MSLSSEQSGARAIGRSNAYQDQNESNKNKKRKKKGVLDTTARNALPTSKDLPSRGTPPSLSMTYLIHRLAYPEHIMHASLLSIEHWRAASARSSALRLASSYVISSSSLGPGDESRLLTDSGTASGPLGAVVAMET